MIRCGWVLFSLTTNEVGYTKGTPRLEVVEDCMAWGRVQLVNVSKTDGLLLGNLWSLHRVLCKQPGPCTS